MNRKNGLRAGRLSTLTIVPTETEPGCPRPAIYQVPKFFKYIEDNHSYTALVEGIIREIYIKTNELKLRARIQSVAMCRSAAGETTRAS
jgi:hypothetical protein